MYLTCNHIAFRVSSLKKTKEFYVKKLELEILENTSTLLALKAGEVRLSFFEGYKKAVISSKNETGYNIILRTKNISSARNSLVKKKIKLVQDITEAPGFLKFITIKDPDNNIIHIGEYLSDPLAK